MRLFSGSNGGGKLEQAKATLLAAIAPTERGLHETPEQRQAVLDAIEKLEASNPTKSPLKSEAINGRWSLIYTTSESILGRKRPAFLRPKGPIYQHIDAINLKARNEETIQPLPFVSYKNQVRAELTPKSDSFVDVQFIQFQLGPLKIPAPKRARGALDTTYLDDSLRISRGDKGNVFVLVKD